VTAHFDNVLHNTTQLIFKVCSQPQQITERVSPRTTTQHLFALIACLSALQTLACFTCLFLSIAEACDRQQHTHEYHTMFYCDICAQDQFEIKLHMQQRQVELLLHSKRAKRRQAGSKRKSRGELSLMDSFQLCASRSQLQILDMCMCCSLIS
jgi:hypothetical protein